MNLRTKILAFDTSGRRVSVALFEGERLKSRGLSPEGARHCVTLAPLIQDQLKKIRWRLKDIQVLIVGLGPGSFTGLRVGLATAKILGYVLNIKIVGVSGLDAVAHRALESLRGRVAVTMDARRGRVYGAVYEKRKGTMRTLLKPSLLPEDFFLAGKVTVVNAEESPAEASSLAKAGRPLIERKKFIDPFELEPLYLQPRDCNVTYARKK